MKVLRKDLNYWKRFFNNIGIPNYINKGTTIGEYVILFPVKKLDFVEKEGFKVDSLKETYKMAKSNDIYNYPCNYIKNKYNLN